MRLSIIFSILAFVFPCAFGTAIHNAVKTPSAQALRGTSSSPRAHSNDIRLLNLVLILEHVVQGMYEQSVANYSVDEWMSAGYSANVRRRYLHIQELENRFASSVKERVFSFGGQPIDACRYKFAFTDVKSFVATSELVETMACSTYKGVLQHVEDRGVAALISSALGERVERATWINSIQPLNPLSMAFEMPLSLNMSFNILGGYVAHGSCPETNDLGSMVPTGVYDYASIDFSSPPRPGSSTSVKLSYLPHPPIPEVLVMAFVTGLTTHYSVVSHDGDGALSALVPPELEAAGAVYVLLVQPEKGKVMKGAVDADSIYAGPTLVMFPFDSIPQKREKSFDGVRLI